MSRPEPPTLIGSSRNYIPDIPRDGPDGTFSREKREADCVLQLVPYKKATHCPSVTEKEGTIPCKRFYFSGVGKPKLVESSTVTRRSSNSPSASYLGRSERGVPRPADWNRRRQLLGVGVFVRVHDQVVDDRPGLLTKSTRKQFSVVMSFQSNF